MRNTLQITTRIRLLISLLSVVCLYAYAYKVRTQEPHTVVFTASTEKPILKTAPHAEPTASDSPALSPTNKPTPTPAPIQEAEFQTTYGLRFVDREKYEVELGEAKSMAAATEALNEFFDQYHVNLTTSTDPFPADGQYSTTFTSLSLTSPDDLANLKVYGSWLIDEWSKYPKGWVRISGVQTVALVKNLANNSLPDWGQSTPERVIFYQVTPLSSLGSTGEDYLRRTIHHEFDHQIEYAVDGGMQAPDAAWSSLNTPGFEYGKTVQNSLHPALGFVTGYSEFAIGEDKAELYSFLFADSKKLAEWEASDPYLTIKGTYYKNFIQAHLPVMNKQYFDAINP